MQNPKPRNIRLDTLAGLGFPEPKPNRKTRRKMDRLRASDKRKAEKLAHNKRIRERNKLVQARNEDRRKEYDQ